MASSMTPRADSGSHFSPAINSRFWSSSNFASLFNSVMQLLRLERRIISLLKNRRAVRRLLS